MFDTAEYLDRVKRKAGIESDYRLAKLAGIDQPTLSRYRTGKGFPGEEAIEKFCKLTGEDPCVIAAEIQAARSHNPCARSLWQSVAHRLSAGGALPSAMPVLFCVALFLLPLAQAHASPSRAGCAAYSFQYGDITNIVPPKAKEGRAQMWFAALALLLAIALGCSF